MNRDDNKKGNDKIKKRQSPAITAYIGLQSVPLGDDPSISVRFSISMRLFCAAFAISRLEKDRDDCRK